MICQRENQGHDTLQSRLVFVISAFVVMMLSACGKPSDTPSVNETGFESAQPVFPGPGGDFGDGVRDKLDGSAFSLDQTTPLRFNKNGVLELVAEVPAGAKVFIPQTYQVHNLDYRKSDGSLARSSTGFITPVTLVSVPASHASQFPQSRIDQINATAGGVYITASVVSEIQGVEGDFEAVKGGTPGEGFLKNYEPSGKPKFNFTAAIKKRFGERLNAGVDPKKQSQAERQKWAKILTELKRAGDRTHATPKAIIMIAKDVAVKASIDFETKNLVPINGAWTIATQATAVRHGFPNVPCAETMSEFVREAYARAGYDVFADFNDEKKNRLIWSSTAAVVNLSAALDKAGWVPWDTTVYKPLTGAIMMHAAGNTPGHTYINAGDDGRIIVDNGAPQGRDLRTTVQKTVELMYQTGLFFLPPGINPQKW